MRKTRITLAAAVVTAALAGASAGPASALTTGGQLVSGTTTGSLALGVTSVPAVLNNFSPGQTATSAVSSPMVVTSTGAWNLFVGDNTGNGGHMAAAALGCTGSEAQTSHQLVVSSSGGSTVTHDGPVTLSAPVAPAVGTQVAHGSLANTLNVDYSLLIDSTEQMLLGCVYSTTATWTVQ